MGTSIKIVNLNGAREALPKKKYIDYPCDKDNVFLQAKREVIDEIESVHLEVDVEAMAKSLFGFDWINLNEKERSVYLNMAKFATKDMSKWARLVRK